MNNLLILLILLCSFSIRSWAGSFTEPVPFKYPIDLKLFSEEINSKESSVALISGGGPAGLLAAHAIYYTKKYTHIIIMEKRSEFSRSNTLSSRTEVLARLEDLNLLEEFKKIAIFSPTSKFDVLKADVADNSMLFEFSKDTLDLDFSKPLTEVLAGDGCPHYGVEIAKLQKMLADEAIKLPNVYLIHGSMDVVVENNDANSAKLMINEKEIFIEKPQIIIIAEGVHSVNREKIGIKFMPVPEMVNEIWDTGAISLSGDLAGYIGLLIDDTIGVRGFLITRPTRSDAFIYSLVSAKTPLPTEELGLKTTAFELLNGAQEVLKIAMPNNPADLQIIEGLSSHFEIIFAQAEKSYSSTNTIIIGDAHRCGSPAEGLGFSLVASVENVAVQEIAVQLFEKHNKIALDKFDDRMNEIAKFWHFSGKI